MRPPVPETLRKNGPLIAGWTLPSRLGCQHAFRCRPRPFLPLAQGLPSRQRLKDSCRKTRRGSDCHMAWFLASRRPRRRGPHRKDATARSWANSSPARGFPNILAVGQMQFQVRVVGPSSATARGQPFRLSGTSRLSGSCLPEIGQVANRAPQRSATCPAPRVPHQRDEPARFSPICAGP